MLINLKKALKVRKTIESELASPELPLTVRLSVFVEANKASPNLAIQTGAAVLEERLVRQSRLSEVLGRLRVAVAKANVEADVEGNLAEEAKIDRRIALLKLVAATPEFPSDEEIKGEIDITLKALQSSETPRYGGPEKSVTVAVVSAERRKAASDEIVALRRRREEVIDARTAVNMTTKIEIAEDDAEFLRELGAL